MNLPQIDMQQIDSPKGDAQTRAGYEGSPALCEAFDQVRAGQPPLARQGRRVTVCHRDDFPAGDKRIVNDGKWSVGVFNVAGSFYAVRNMCPHAGAPLCQGTVHATHEPSGVGEYEPAYEGRILRCPWHGWEFDIVTGKGLYDRKSRVATYPVLVDEQGMVVIIR